MNLTLALALVGASTGVVLTIIEVARATRERTRLDLNFS